MIFDIGTVSVSSLTVYFIVTAFGSVYFCADWIKVQLFRNLWYLPMRCYPLLALYELQHTGENRWNAFSILIGFDFFACENVNQQGNHLINFIYKFMVLPFIISACIASLKIWSICPIWGGGGGKRSLSVCKTYKYLLVGYNLPCDCVNS